MADELFASEVHVVDGEAVLAVRGEIDIANAEDFAELLLATVEAATSHVVVDASGLRYIDSSGVRGLVNAATRAKARDISFVIRDPQPNTRRVLEILGLAEHLFKAP
jgi:anti-anti-sigma factor